MLDAAPAEPVEVDDPEEDEAEAEAFKLPDAILDPEEAPVDGDEEAEAETDDVIVLLSSLVEDESADEKDACDEEPDATDPEAELTTVVGDETAAEVVIAVIVALD